MNLVVRVNVLSACLLRELWHPLRKYRKEVALFYCMVKSQMVDKASSNLEELA